MNPSALTIRALPSRFMLPQSRSVLPVGPKYRDRSIHANERRHSTFRALSTRYHSMVLVVHDRIGYSVSRQGCSVLLEFHTRSIGRFELTIPMAITRKRWRMNMHKSAQSELVCR